VNKVANPRKPLRLNVGFIINAPIGYNRDFDFELPLLKIDEDLTLTNFQGIANIGRTPQGLIVQGNFSGMVKLECVRCLGEYDQTLQWEFTELYAFDRKSITESELTVPEDAHIDLQPLVRDFALLEIPIKPLCKPECKGLCMVCGEDLNKRDCGHRPDGDSPFAALKQLLD
jgi:uncharacterized protein